MVKKILKSILFFFRKPHDYPLRKGKKRNFIFIHINKTGGTSIAHSVGLPHKKHLTTKEVIDIVGKRNFEKAVTFGVVRNPWCKVVSHYKFRVKMNRSNMQTNPISFEKWVECTYGENKDPFYYNKAKMFMPHVDWFKDHKGNIVVDRIIRFENLQSEFEVIANEIGIDPVLPHLNQTYKDDYRKYYNENTKAIIEKCFKEDIEAFGYTF